MTTKTKTKTNWDISQMAIAVDRMRKDEPMRQLFLVLQGICLVIGFALGVFFV